MARHFDTETRGACLSVAAGIIWLCAAGLIAVVFGKLLANEAQSLPLAGAGLLGLWGLRAFLESQSQRLLANAAEAKIAELRREIIEREAQSESQSCLGGPGAIAALVTEKLEALRPALLRYRPARLRVTVLPLVILVIAFWHSWAVGLVLLLAGPLIPLFMALVGWAAKDASARQMQEIGELSDFLVDRLAALSELRLIGAGPATVESFAHSSDNLRQRTMAVLRIAFLSSTVLELFSALGVAMVAVWVGFSLLGELNWGSWGVPLTPTIGLYLLLLAPEYFQPLRDLAAAWHDRAAGEAVLDEVEGWRDEVRTRRLGSGAQADPFSVPLLVELSDVEHRGIRYPDILINPGDSLAIEGGSGAGKTTLLRLIAGLERPDHGQVLLDGVPLDDKTVDQWRAGIGWMPQAPHFANGTVRYNIGFGEQVAEETMQAAGLRDVIDTLPRGDLTRLGERGAGLSGGEGRRVTLARALHGTSSMLIADEPTADLDMETAGAVGDSLVRFAQTGGTLVIATHDPVLAARMSKRIEIVPAGDLT